MQEGFRGSIGSGRFSRSPVAADGRAVLVDVTGAAIVEGIAVVCNGEKVHSLLDCGRVKLFECIQTAGKGGVGMQLAKVRPGNGRIRLGGRDFGDGSRPPELEGLPRG